MEKERLSAFSDGVIAIIVTIMVLELKPPHSADMASLEKLTPTFLAYVLSFVYVAIYWNNHHHMMYTVKKVNASIMWANMGLLFWLSLIPFATGWMGENHFASLPSALYGVVLLMSAIAYFILQAVILRQEGPNSLLARALGKDAKGKISLVAYLFAIPLAFVDPRISALVYSGVAILWLIPDRRIERVLSEQSDPARQTRKESA